MEIELPASAAAPGLARQALAELDLAEPPAANAALLTSEVVSNSVLHGSSAAVRLTAARRDDWLRVEVCDDGSGFVWTGRPEDVLTPGGLGLVLVDAVAYSWGVDSDGRTCVWFELPVND